MTTNHHTTGLRIEGWLTQPPAHHKRPSEGHASAVRVLRMANSRHQHAAAEPVPFRARTERPAPLRSIKPAAQSSKAATPTPHQPTGCAGHGGHCIGHPDCPDHQCEGHPDNTGGAQGFTVPAKERDPVALRWALAGLATLWLALISGSYLALRNL